MSEPGTGPHTTRPAVAAPGTRVLVVGGGAAGFFAAIACAEQGSGREVVVLERSAECLGKVRISGGGRCNVTHTPGDPREFAAYYPRGGQALIGALGRFGAADTVAWFAARGVALKTQPDGRLFPTTDRSETVIECLRRSAAQAGVTVRANCGVERVGRGPTGGFELTLSRGEVLTGQRLLLATGGCRSSAQGALATSLGHALEPPVPSLFGFQIETPWLRELPGVAVADVEVWVPGTRWRERGPLIFTHAGVSGPAILRLSAWGARDLATRGYRFPLLVNWLPGRSAGALAAELGTQRQRVGARLVSNAPLAPLTARLWERLALAAGIGPGTRWAGLTRPAQEALVRQLARTELPVSGKSLNRDEFVTCGGVRLAEVDFRTMESRVCPGLHFAGELLDIDGLTGGFNFQAAWTTGWLAGRAMATAPGSRPADVLAG